MAVNPLMLQYPNPVSVPTNEIQMKDYYNSLANYGPGTNPFPSPDKSWWDSLSDKLPDFLNMKSFAGYKDKNTGENIAGWGTPAAQIGTGVMNSWLGLKQYGLAKDQLAMNKDQFNRNFAAQANTTNAELADRQARRVLEDPRAQSVASYMAQYGVR